MAKTKLKPRAKAEPAKHVLDEARRTAEASGDLSLKALTEAVAQRKPFAAQDIRAALQRLDGEVAALVNRRELVAQTLEVEQRGRESDIAARKQKLQQALADVATREAGVAERRTALPARIEARTVVLTAEIEKSARRAKQLGKLLRQAEKAAPLPDDGRPVEQAGMPATRDIVALLEESGNKDPSSGISHEQAKAARQIAQINEAISAAGQVKAVNLAGVGGGGGGPFRDIVIAGNLDELRSRKYLPWCAALSEAMPVTLDIVVKVAVYGCSLRALEDRHHLRHGTAILRLREGLDAFINQPRVPGDKKALTVAMLDS